MSEGPREQPTQMLGVEEWMINEGDIPVDPAHDLKTAKAIQDRQAAKDLRVMETGGADSVTRKITVGGIDFYTHVAFSGDRAIHIMVDGFKEDDNRQRSPLELLCEGVSDLLRRRLVTLDEVLGGWRGTRFPPEGPCPQLQGANAKSPLDAIGWHLSGMERAE